MNIFLTKLLGASWRTSFWGGITVLAGFISQYPDLVSSVVEPVLAKKIFSIAALISAFVTFTQAKDKNVTGGTIPSGETPTKTETKIATALVDATKAADKPPVQ